MNDNQEIWITDFTIEKSIQYRQQILDKASENNSTPIILYINSYGGEAAALMTILDTLDNIPNPIITVASGTAMSCGAFLLMYGDQRFMGRNSELMFHRASGMSYGTDLDTTSSLESSKRMTEKVTKLALSKLKRKNKIKFQKKMNSNVDFYLSAEEALDMGIITEIGVPRLVEIKQVGLLK